ncbi:biotin transporter BioY [Gordonia sp. CPCC 206044]|uniref:biotin transporter BioY n=1 Tax=Gordonia sp. CPCC 206044 TaxID=3140793 RepID=UPI003AF3F03A
MEYSEVAMNSPTKPRSGWSLGMGDLTQAAVFAALIAALGLPGTINLASGVPITLQSMGVMLAGAILGPKKGTLAVVLFAVLALAGLPILAGGRSGWTALSSPTGGFFVGFLPAVAIIGVLTALMMWSGPRAPRYRVLPGIVINLLGGMAVLYLCGIVGLTMRGMSLGAAITTNGPFVIGDVVKAVVTALVAAQVHRGWPGLIGPLRWRRTAPSVSA